MFEHCKLCIDDKDVFCPRDVDVKCLVCNSNFCGAHIIEHLREHCIATDLFHCKKEESNVRNQT
ncbi:MAG: hypothetical protein SCARUB_01291 [Candidatus Scalindua rubra]|uniref:Uncharacterized protein n=1 Tax=Candidatus Scalindua rubra TaxID=1872076 RepID=A0A1E3XD43_9BACT|nr:MAG: hypothetical protein SCARUB_01291 [Candidatus Scalindua rubra]